MKIVAKFANTQGQVLVATFNQADGTVSDNQGRKGTFKVVPEKKTIEIQGDAAITFSVSERVDFVPGFSTQYSASNGSTGTVTIESVG